MSSVQLHTLQIVLAFFKSSKPNYKFTHAFLFTQHTRTKSQATKVTKKPEEISSIILSFFCVCVS